MIIEFKEISYEEDEDGNPWNPDAQLLINNKEYDVFVKEKYHIETNKEGEHISHYMDYELIFGNINEVPQIIKNATLEQLLLNSKKELASIIIQFQSKIKEKIWSPKIWIFADERPSFHQSEYSTNQKIILNLDINEWAETISFNQFIHQWQTIEENSNNKYPILESGSSLVGYQYYFDIDVNGTIEEIYHQATTIFNEAIANAYKVILQKSRQITSSFHFPPEIKIACEQYLMYFTQFLSDLGIEAIAEMKEEHDTVFFAVSPKDEKEALSNIRAALETYLNLPEAENIDIIATQSQDQSAMQLMSQIHFLKSQLMMANATIQLKDATIQSLQISNYQLTQTLPSKTDKGEKILGGIAEIKKYDGKGFSIDLPELFRRMKRIWPNRNT